MGQLLSPGRYLGTPGRPFVTPSFRVLDSVYAPGESIPVHAHERAHLCLVLRGGYTERVGRRTYERRAGSLAGYAAETDHAERHHAAGRHLLIEPRHAGAAAFAPAVEAGPAPWLAHRIWAELVTERDALAVDALGFELLGVFQAERPERRPPRWLEAVDDTLRASFVDPPRVPELAADAGVHPVHLARTYRRHRGHSIADAVRHLRVRAALRLLAADRWRSLAEVAALVGFADQSHLTRCFKRLTGATPARWRRAVRAR